MKVTNPVYKVVIELTIDVNDKNFDDSAIEDIVEQYIDDKFGGEVGEHIMENCFLDSYEIESVYPIYDETAS